jgi:hypothetical protein
MDTLIRLFRSYGEKSTIGKAWVETNDSQSIFQFNTLELPWNDNQRRISCIPEGQYKWVKHISPKFGATIWLQNVPNRSEILIHRGNFTSDILGCILPGDDILDVNGDGIPDVTNSRVTMRKLLDNTGNSGIIRIETI